MAAALTAPLLGGTKTVKLPEAVFAVDANLALLHETVKAELARRRQGTHATKTRGLVAGGRAKPWRQKGTGRARQGTTRAVHWTGGGVAFGPSPRSYELKVNRKAARKARAMALTQHARGGSLAVLDAEGISQPRTKDAVALLSPWRSQRPCLVLVTNDEEPAALSFRNLERTDVIAAHEVDVADLLRARTLVVSKGALAFLTGGEAA
jgi:large subunit ribosomal protein L4